MNFKEYWSDRTNSGNRSNTDAWLQAKAIEIVQIIGADSGLIIADVGVGAGELLSHVAPMVRSVTAVDYSESMLGAAR